MIIKNTERLRNLDALLLHIQAFSPTNEIETQTKAALLALAQSRRAELRRALVSQKISARKTHRLCDSKEQETNG